MTDYGDPIPCQFCDGDGEIHNLANLNPHRRIEDWLPPQPCGRCGGTGWDPDRSHPTFGYPGRGRHLRSVS